MTLGSESEHERSQGRRAVSSDESCDLYLTGNFAYRSLQNEPKTIGISEDGNAKFGFLPNDHGNSLIEVINFKEPKERIQFPLLEQNGEPRVLIANGEYIVLQGNSLQFVPKAMTEAKSTGKVKSLKLPNQIGTPKFIQVSSDHQFVAYVQSYSESDDARTVLVNLKSGEKEYLQKPNVPTLKDGNTHRILDMKIMTNVGSVVTLHDEGTLSIWNSETKNEKIIQIFQNAVAAQLSSDGKSVYVLSSDNQLSIKNLKGETLKEINLHEVFGAESKKLRPVLKFSDDGKRASIIQGGRMAVIDLEAGTVRSLHDPNFKKVKKIDFSSGGKYIHTESEDPYAQKAEHFETANSRLFLSDRSAVREILLPNKYNRFAMANSPELKTTKLLGLSQGKAPYLIDNLSTACVNKNLPRIELSKKEHEIEAVKKAAFLNSKHCSQSSSVGTVRTELATLSGLNPLDTRKAYEALLNFQVPGVIQPEKDLPLLLAILNSELVMREPELIVGLLANILGASNMLYESLILKYPKLQTLKKDLSYPDTVKKCLSEKQQKKIEKDVSDYLDQRLSLFLEHDGETLIPAYNEDWKYLVPLTSLLSKLPDSRKAHYIEYIADTLFAAATSDRNLRGIPDAVKLEFVTQAINPLFGKSQDSKTDAVLVKEGNQSMLKVLGNRHLSGVNGNSRNYDQLGFNMLSVPLTQPTDIESAQWEHDGRKYEATVRKRIQIPIAIEENVNQLLNHPESCKFTQENSHWNQDGVLAKQIAREPGRRSRIVVTTGGNDLVKKCEEVKARLGSKSCENIEITGHMSGGCGASQLFFVRTRDVGQNTFITEPSDQKIFQKAVNCFNDLLREGKPLIITACFSAQPRDMMEMKRVMQRPIIAAAGLCSSVGWGASSDSGWSELSSDIPPPVEIREVQ